MRNRLWMVLQKNEKWRMVAASAEYTEDLSKCYNDLDGDKAFLLWTLRDGLRIYQLRFGASQYSMAWSLVLEALPIADQSSAFLAAYETVIEYIRADIAI